MLVLSRKIGESIVIGAPRWVVRADGAPDVPWVVVDEVRRRKARFANQAAAHAARERLEDGRINVRDLEWEAL